MVVRMIVWTCAVSSWDAAIQYRKGTGTDTTHWRIGPGDDPRNQVGGGLGHAPTGTRRTKPPALAAEWEQQLLVARAGEQRHSRRTTPEQITANARAADWHRS